MKYLRRTLKIDMRRSILSPIFCISVLIIIFWLLLNCIQYFTSSNFRRFLRAEYVLNLATTGFSEFTNLILVISATVYAWSYCQDKNSGYFEQIINRVGLSSYSVSKIISTALSAFLAAVIALGIFTTLLYIVFQGEMPNEFIGGIAYLNLVAASKSGWYFLIRFTITGLTCSLGAVFGLMVTAYIPNVFMAFLMPLMTFYFYEIIAYVLDIKIEWLSLYQIMFGQALDDDIAAFFVAAGELLLFIILCGFLFCRKVRKEQKL